MTGSDTLKRFYEVSGHSGPQPPKKKEEVNENKQERRLERKWPEDISGRFRLREVLDEDQLAEKIRTLSDRAPRPGVTRSDKK